MPSWLPSIRYPPSQHGYWDPVTSTINWCEEVRYHDHRPLDGIDDPQDYYATIYSAEIVNTMTNLLFIYLAYKGIRLCLDNGHDQIFLVTFVGYLLVGSGSFLFHATLKYPWQLVDELSMIYTTCLMFFASFSHKRKAPIPALLAIFLICLSLFITGYYHYLQDPKFHQNMYALLTAIVLFRSMYIMETSLRPSLRGSATNAAGNGAANGKAPINEQERKRQDERDARILRLMWTLIAVGLSVFLGGFGIWNIDNWKCTSLRRIRREIGLPWGILLEGHGWWHLMTGTGAYFYIIWGIWLRHCLNGRQDEFELVWPTLFTSLPVIVKRRPATSEKAALKKNR